jgi:hypothetical protein
VTSAGWVEGFEESLEVVRHSQKEDEDFMKREDQEINPKAKTEVCRKNVRLKNLSNAGGMVK